MAKRINTWPVINLFLMLQFALLFFALVSERKAGILRWLCGVLLLFELLNFFFVQKPTVSNSYSLYISSIFMIVAALHYLYELMRDMPVERVQTLPLFWLAFGVLIYYAGNLFLFLFNNYLLDHGLERHQVIWVLHNLLNMSKNFFLFMTLWMARKTSIYKA